jgi:hypothetical protein
MMVSSLTEPCDAEATAESEMGARSIAETSFVFLDSPDLLLWLFDERFGECFECSLRLE